VTAKQIKQIMSNQLVQTRLI